MIRVALAQIEIKEGDVEENILRVDRILNDYANSHELIVFPETNIMGFPSRDICHNIAQTLDGPIIKYFEQKTRELNTTITIGLYEKENENIFNTTVIIGPEGLMLSYRKTHLWVGGETERVDAGNAFYSCAWKKTKIAPLICYDVEFPETARIVASLGAEILILTNGNMDPYGPVHRIACQARAQENQIFVIMANRVGEDNDCNFYSGGSLVVNPYGKIIAEAGEKEEVLSATLDMSLVQKSRDYYNHLKEHKLNISNVKETVIKGLSKVEF